MTKIQGASQSYSRRTKSHRKKLKMVQKADKNIADDE
jgi:hypothetical protein